MAARLVPAPQMARILLIDGDKQVRDRTLDLLRRISAHDVIAAADGAAGLQRALVEDFDLVVLEVDLPDVDGFEVVTRLREQARGRRVPVVLTSRSRSKAERRLRSLEIGAADFIVQPINGLEFAARVDSVLRSSALAAEARRHAAELQGVIGEQSRRFDELALELRVERDALRETFDVIEDGLFLLDRSGKVLLENQAGRRLRAETAETPYFFEGTEGVAEASLEDVLERLADDVARRQSSTAASMARGGQHFEARAHPAAGDRALVYVRDITLGRDTEVRRLQSEKLASIGMLATGVAHEINNPASFVLANTEALGGLLRVMEDRLRHDADMARRLGLRDLLFEAMAIVQESKEGMVRIHRIVRDLHSFSRVDDEPGGVTDVNAAVDSALTMLRNELRYRAEVKRDLSATRLVGGSSARLGQVFLNLIMNAAHALPEGELRRNRLYVRSRDDGNGVVVEVQDNGPGIPAEVMPRIFESFFTTKPPGIGTGLGLSISREIVRSAGGEIEAVSTPGAGALFRVRLPAAPDATPIEPPTPAPLLGRRRYRILAVDDEALLLKAYRRMLSEHHEVVLAGGGDDALDLLSKDQKFDVILCDLQMPEISGADVYREVSRRWPGLEHRFIVITGGAFSPEGRRFLEEGLVTSVNKPFQLAEILELIERRVAAIDRLES
jgi:signal transduction histidine kinase